MPQQTVLIVDDNPENLTVLGELLHVRYKVRAATSGARALQLARQAPLPDLILLDIMMPNMSGYQVLEQLRDAEATRDIPVIFISAMSATEDEQRGLVLGAVDYIGKPLRPAIVLARVHTQLELKRMRDRLQCDNQTLEQEIARRMRENLLIQDITIRALARAGRNARQRDRQPHPAHPGIRAHAGPAPVQPPAFCRQLDERSIALLAKSAPLHDIGKVGIPDHVLLKPGPLTPDEWEIMKTHARLGAEAIERAEADTQQTVLFLALCQGGGAAPPRALGRQRLPRRPGRRCHPAVGPPDGGGRRLRCADLAPRLQGADPDGRGAHHHGGRARPALRSRHARRLSRRLRRVLRHRQPAPRRPARPRLPVRRSRPRTERFA